MTEAAAVRAEVRLPRAGFTLDVRFAAPARGITGILGHSGSGKTTLLRCIAGLEPECRGEVAVNGAVWQDASRFAPPHARAAGFVFQDARLFPHLTVRHNLEYGLRRASGNGGVSFDEAVELLGLAPLLARKPAGLSAGEAQRVALARALLRAPSVMLMDEPLANLDPPHQADWMQTTRALVAEGRTVVSVLHELPMALAADELVVMNHGRVVHHGGSSDAATHAALEEVFDHRIRVHRVADQWIALPN
jgi:iron complex transport system ATP-binding protein